MFTSIDELEKQLAEHDYITDRMLATSIFLAIKMQKPLLLEGEPGVGILIARKIEVSNERTKYDPVVRAWANHDNKAKKSVEKVDKLRLTFLIELFTDAGFDTEESEIRARMLYYYVLGEAYVTRKESKALRLKRIESKARIFTAPF